MAILAAIIIIGIWPAMQAEADIASRAGCRVPIGQAIAAAGCCRVCRTGKPCGDSCIAKDKRCTKSPGCACEADGRRPS